MKYKSKPVEVEAMQWNVADVHTGWPGGPRITYIAAEVVAWVNANGGEARMGWEIGREWEKEHNSHIAVRTINGWAYAAPGHYVVMGEATFTYQPGEYDGVRNCRDFYPCDPETFERRWEPA